MLEAGVDVAQITFTSDGQGSLPDFDAQGGLRRLGGGPRDEPASPRSATRCCRRACRLRPRCRPSPSNPARILKLRGKGNVAAGADADIVLLDAAQRSTSAASSRAAAG